MSKENLAYVGPVLCIAYFQRGPNMLFYEPYSTEKY